MVEISEPIGWVCVRLNALLDVDDRWMSLKEDDEEEKPDADADD